MHSTKGTFNSLILRAPICKINSQKCEEKQNFFHSSITHSTNTYFKLFMIEEIHSFFLRKHWHSEKKFLKKQSNSFFSNVESLKSYSWSKFYFSKVFQVKEAWFFVTSHFVTYSISLHIQFECGKMPTRITPSMDTFYPVVIDKCYLREMSERGMRLWNF